MSYKIDQNLGNVAMVASPLVGIVFAVMLMTGVIG